MCQAISGKAVLGSNERLTVYTLRHSDSHEEITTAYNIRDESTVGVAARQTPVELVPVRSLKSAADSSRPKSNLSPLA